MGLFNKKPSTPSAVPSRHPVSAFWAWWGESGHRLSPHEVSSETDELARLVAAIHPGLAWHFGPGTRAQHRLTVSAGGIADGRPAAERWFRAAPAAGPVWEFSPRQEADPDAMTQVLQIAGVTVNLEATTFSVDADTRANRIHVAVHHPSFAAIPDDVRAQVSFLALDWLLGEDDVARWLGRVSPSADVVPGPVPASVVRQVVADMAAQRDPDEWVLAQFDDGQGTPVLASFRSWLHWLDDPVLDRYHGLSIPFVAQANGQPVDATALDTLHALETELDGVIGHRGLLIGHQTHRGERLFHAYSDGDDQNAAGAIAEWASARGIQHETIADPGWSRVRHLLG